MGAKTASVQGAIHLTKDAASISFDETFQQVESSLCSLPGSTKLAHVKSDEGLVIAATA